MGSVVRVFKRELASRNIVESGELLANTAADLGWERVAFACDTRSVNLPVDTQGQYVASRMGWHQEYLTEWEQRHLARACPVALACNSRSRPFFWEARGESKAWFGQALITEQREILDYYRLCARVGVTVPIHRAGGKIGYVSWFSTSPGQAREMWQNQDDDLFLLSHSYLQHLDQLEQFSASKTDQGEVMLLTPRELECLTWAARGKTEEEIALILGRSQGTAHFHLCNAAAKLNASNRVHAVAKACSLGLITVIA
jgi:DNA-binding CsgD family transcriptional regulator